MMINNKVITNKNIPLDKFKTGNISSINKKTNEVSDFSSILKEKLTGDTNVKISKHAQIRMDERNIKLTDELKDKINKSIDKANEKGVKESLVLTDNVAFIVNIKNRTVVTAFSEKELKDSVFTNIDGAVIG